MAFRIEEVGRKMQGEKCSLVPNHKARQDEKNEWQGKESTAKHAKQTKVAGLISRICPSRFASRTPRDLPARLTSHNVAVLGQPRVECGEPQRAKRSPGKAGDGSMAVSGNANMPLVIIRTATSLTARVLDRAYQITKMSSEVGCPDTEVRHLQLGGHCVGACDSVFLPTVLLSDRRDHRAHGIVSLLICDLCAICGWYLIFFPDSSACTSRNAFYPSSLGISRCNSAGTCRQENSDSYLWPLWLVFILRAVVCPTEAV